MSKAQKTVNATACGKRVKVEDSRHCHLKDKLFFSILYAALLIKAKQEHTFLGRKTRGTKRKTRKSRFRVVAHVDMFVLSKVAV